jgi:hypothetical protein
LSDDHIVELFIMKCAVIELSVRSLNAISSDGAGDSESTNIDKILPYLRQFAASNRNNASRMARYYEIFYMLENEIRDFISSTLEAAHGINWWDKVISHNIKEEAKRNRDREQQAAITVRSDEDIDYTTFGQLSDIISENWVDFAGMLSDIRAVKRVLSGLNTLRGTIAHCGVLAEDEVDRLFLSIKDWFRVLQGPKS